MYFPPAEITVEAKEYKAAYGLDFAGIIYGEIEKRPFGSQRSCKLLTTAYIGILRGLQLALMHPVDGRQVETVLTALW